MYEEQRLMKFGYPLDEALCLCHSLRREGTITEFAKSEEGNCACGGKCGACGGNCGADK